MANLAGILGMLLATRMAGRGRYGSALGTAALLRGGLARKAGLAGLGYLAYRAYQDGKADRAAAGGADGPAGRDAARESSGPGAAAGGGIAGTLGNLLDSLTGGQVASRKGEPGLGDKLGNYFDPGSAEPAGETAAPPEAARQPMDDGRALLLIRAMIAAANADGRISDEERRRVLAAVDEADGDAGDHRLIEHELLDPKPLDSLLAEVGDHDTARQLYAVSRAAMDGETPTQIAYLDYLRNRLGLPPDETAEIDEAMQ
jgi:uncharacterized membrane protein YebE (DUF533 family)